MGSVALAFNQVLETESCSECGIIYAMPQDFRRKQLQLRERGWFFCPSGHRQCYIGQSLEQRLAAETSRREMAQRQLVAEQDRLRKAKRDLSRAKKRAAAALCPVPGCCRTFVQMRRHLKAKHPEFKG